MKIRSSLSRLLHLEELIGKDPQDTYIFFYHKLPKSGKLLVAIPMLYVDYYSSCWTSYENVEEIARSILFEKVSIKCNWDKRIKIKDGVWGKKIKDIDFPLRYHIKYTKKDVPWSNFKPTYIRSISDSDRELTKEQFNKCKGELHNKLNDSALEAELTAGYEEFLDRRNELPRVAELKAKEVVEGLINKLEG